MRKMPFALAAAFLFSSCVKEINSDDAQIASGEETVSSMEAQPSEVGKYVAGDVLVKFKTALSDEQFEKVMATIGGKLKEKVLTKAMEQAGDKNGVFLVSTALETSAALSKLKELAEVLYAEPNFIYTHSAVSNDTYFTNGSLWGMYGDGSSPANEFGSQAAEAWANNTGSSAVYVGIIDEGVMHTHPDLDANIWTNPYDPADGKDNDGNGYTDDIRGWDFDGNNNSTYDGTQDDHGTHVAGTIGAEGGNGTGVAGVCWNVKLITAKFLGNYGGTTANAIKAVDYFTNLKAKHGLNIVATNNSWGGGGFSQALQDAIERANAQNILFIAAAGNNTSNNDAVNNYPSNYPNANIIAVASITSTGALSSFSNWGATQVDIGAPGSGIWSTVPGTSTRKKGSSSGGSYASYSGTSMATPHVTGAAALYKSSHSGADAAAIKSAIHSSAVPTGSLSGKCVTGGRLNVSGF